MPDVITLDEARAHLNITTNARDADLNDKLAAATAVVISYLQRHDAAWNAEMEAWTSDTIPRDVRHAILIMLGELDKRRGDEPNLEAPPDSISLPPTVRALLLRYKTPLLA